MQKTLKEKFVELVNNKFSEEACFNFFGNLNENEIKLMLENLSKENPSLNAEQRNFLQTYLEKLLEKIEEIKKQTQ
ncbi:MAG: hypothetical protein WC725_04475 [Patescibacteria group bacterium]|jgi:hypothetical protein